MVKWTIITLLGCAASMALLAFAFGVQGAVIPAVYYKDAALVFVYLAVGVLAAGGIVKGWRRFRRSRT